MASPTQDYTTIIGPDAAIKGEIRFESPARVLGRIEGSINSTAAVLIAEGAQCRANITAREVAVEGQVAGNIEVDGRVDLRPGGSVEGDITASRMTMAEGATVNGHFRVGVSGQGKPAAAATEVKPAAESGAATGRPGAHVPQTAAGRK